MTNPDDIHLANGTGFMDSELRAAIQRTLSSESETARRVRWRTTVTEAYTQLYQVYEELRESGHAFAWATAHEASALAGMLLAELGDLLGERQKFPPTQEATHPTPPCRSTQHCAAWGWCHRCDPRAGDAARHVIKAVSAMDIPPAASGAVYAAAMHALRHPDQAVGEDPCPGK